MSAHTLKEPQLLADRLKHDFQRALSRTETIFNLIEPAAYYKRPITLRHPINFYEGHLAAFIWNTLFSRVLNEPSFNPAFDQLFERGIDPGTAEAAQAASISAWPSRQEVCEYKNKIHKRLFNYLDTVNFESTTHPLLKQGEVLFLLLEHEQMHQETLLYMLHQLPYEDKKIPTTYHLPPDKKAPEPLIVHIPAGKAFLGAQTGEFDFVWDNELPGVTVDVGAFSMDVFNVTNEQFLEFVEAGGYEREEFWSPEAWRWKQEQQKAHPQNWIRSNSDWQFKSFFEEIPLPLSWPVYVTQAEAAAYACFVGKELPTEAEWHRAAYGEKQMARHSWQENTLQTEAGHANFKNNFNFQHWTPVPVGSYPESISPFGVHDLIGNGWEWTCTQFTPFSGFQASLGYPQYSADFFDGQHYVIKGASCFTDTRLLRRSFRNWYYWHYPYMYATFRCVKRS